MKATSFFLPADGSSEGIVLAAIDSHLTLQNPALTNHTISTFVIDSKLNVTFDGYRGLLPQGELDKKMFIRELRPLRQTALPNWLILGDFNLIYQDVDKSNSRVKMRLMLIFRRALNFLKVKKINLIVRKNTWSN
jgi:hypothetical protein